VPLDHYAVSGVIWGRESVWIDDRKQIIAAITFAPSLEPIQAIREGYESALSAFLTRAAEDGITDLARITGQLSPPHTEPLAIVGGTVVDGTGRPPLTDATVLIQRDRIVATGPRTIRPGRRPDQDGQAGSSRRARAGVAGGRRRRSGAVRDYGERR
jgi:hypothetical protein